MPQELKEEIVDKCQNELFNMPSYKKIDFNSLLNLQRNILEKYIDKAGVGKMY